MMFGKKWLIQKKKKKVWGMGKSRSGLDMGLFLLDCIFSVS